MFKRFQTPKDLTPYPPIEQDIKCPKCGFNHDGWAFEPGYAKLCVKCGTALEPSEDPGRLDGKDDKEAGLLGRIVGGVFGSRKDGPEHRETGEVPVPARPPFQSSVEDAEPCNEPLDAEAERIGACKRDGRLLAEQGRYGEAIEMLEKVVAFEPNDLESWARLGRIHYKGTKDLQKSIECSRRALQIDEDLVWVKCNLCLALLFDGQFDLAKKGFLEVIRTVRSSRGYDEEFQENCKTLLHDCLGELYVSKKEASGERLAHTKEIIELLEIEKIYFQ